MLSNQKPSIILSNPQLHSDTFTNTVTYIITTHDGSGKYENLRNYTDFVKLRKSMCKKWPGIYIPTIPNSPLFSSISSKFIKTYKKQIEYFLEYISGNSFLYTTEEFQSFLKSKNYTKKNIKYNDYEIAINYQAIFHEYTGVSLDDQKKRNLQEKEEFYRNRIDSLVTIRDNSEQLMLEFREYHNLLASISNQILKTEKLHTLDFEDPEIWCPINLPNVKNHYQELYNWAENEIFEIEAMLQAISACEMFEKIYNSLESKISNYDNELEKIGQNKVSLLKFFSFKSKDKYSVDIKKKLNDKENQAYNIRVLQTIIMCRLLDKDIPLFNDSRVNMFTHMQGLYNDILSKSLESFTEATKSTLKNLNKNDKLA